MAKKKHKKFYVVWRGRKTGILESWKECKDSIHNCSAIYKAFYSKESAEEAFSKPPQYSIGRNRKKEPKQPKIQFHIQPELDSICVDCAFSTSTQVAQYRGVNTKTSEILFSYEGLQDSTNNIAEFLAIVHGLAYCKQNNIDKPIYSDSITALAWVKKKNVYTTLKQTDKNHKSFELVERAVKWLKENKYGNKILKWDTVHWGEIKADYGNK